MANQRNINQESMLRTGTILHGTYRIDDYLSSGGFGNTYVATHTLFGTKRAIKEFFMRGVTQREGNTSVISVSNSENVDEFNHQLEKFKKEARRLYQLDYKNIVKVHDLFEENGTAYYVMDYIDGEDLRHWLERMQRPMTEDEVNALLPQVLNALQEVHSQGIWHLDLKPANIMVDGNMIVKLIDFGASKQFDSERGGVTSSAVAYTNGYAPFEQMEKNHDKFGPWTDFYALGATLYNLLTNKKPPMPSDINDDHTDDKHLALAMPSTVSLKTRDLVLWLMTPSRDKRPRDVAEIRTFMKTEPIEVPPIPTQSVQVPPIPNIEENTRIGSADEAQEQKTETPVKKQSITPEKRPIKPEPSEKKNEPKVVKIEEKSRKRNIGNYFLIALAILLLAGMGYLLYQRFGTGSTNNRTVENQNVILAIGNGSYTGEVNPFSTPDGKGTIVFSNGDKLKGTFVNGNVTGENIKYDYANGDKFYGIFEDNKFIKGRYTIAKDGSYFEGTFKDDEPYDGYWFDKNGKKIETVNKGKSK